MSTARRLVAVTATLAFMLLGAAVTAPAASADESPGTKTMSWYMPDGVNPHEVPFSIAYFPQTSEVRPCVWVQKDVYSYGTPQQRAAVDALDDDGQLSWIDGKAEDDAVYVSHEFVAPTGCGSAVTTVLAQTGSNTWIPVGLGMALLLAGTVLVMAGRKQGAHA